MPYAFWRRSAMKRLAAMRLTLVASTILGIVLLCAALWNRAGAAGPTSAQAVAPSPAAPSVGWVACGCGHEWPRAGSGPTTPFGQGTYVDPGRLQHVPEYRLRVDDVVELVYRRTHEETGPYQLNVGDRLRVELPPAPMGT